MMTNKVLKEKIKSHKQWLDNDGGERLDLSSVKLLNADLRNADLRYSDLTYASLSNAQLDERELCRLGEYLHEPLQGWKKCRDGVIVELEIPVGAIVFSINNSKCRTNKAKVIGIEGASKGISYHQDMSYYVGDVLDIRDFNVQYNIECETGIHFFKKKDDAIRY